MKDILQDLVAHTHALGFIPVIKVTADNNETNIEAMADDRSVILNGKMKNPVEGINGVFGMPNLNKLDIHLKCPEYKENAKINITTATKDGDEILTGLHFENESGDFQNNYRFMSTEIVNEKLKTVKFKGANWDISFTPALTAIQKLKFQANAHSEESVFEVSTSNNDLIFSFGDNSTHTGSFVFQAGTGNTLSQTWSWPVNQVLSILNLSGNIEMKISSAGAMQISVDSGLAEYNYILPAQVK